ncbi:adenylosuccinate synthetase, partial [Vicingaceae bacterium]|nr:adenylosuccinate synthetase [Vicingaceae bacterium]
TGRNGLRMGDSKSVYFKEKYDALQEKHKTILGDYDYNELLTELEIKWFEAMEFMSKFTLIDSEHYINNAMNNGQTVLAEGAQGAMLDVDFGTYPFVTSSNTITAGTCTGLGVAPNRIGEVIGIFKAYCTRVGSGPFPTELDNAVGENIRKLGFEYGATTGRDRRCGWIDLPALKYAIMINGATQLSMMKADVLDTFETIEVCTHYEIEGELCDYFPYDINSLDIRPIYKQIKGWNKDLTGLTDMADAPKEFMDYITYLEGELNVPITIVSVGPDRKQTLMRENVMA